MNGNSQSQSEEKKDILLKVEGLTKKFGALTAVDSLNLEVERGEFSVLFGPNGAGKTTLTNLITGFLKNDAGRVWFNGKEITDPPSTETYQLGIVRSFQIPRIYTSLTVLENVLLACCYHPGESFLKAPMKLSWKSHEEKKIREAFKILELLELEDAWDDLGGELSGGQAKLLDIGRSLMGNAQLMLIDEPIGGVNPNYFLEE
ncbi:MAG: ATP-binding cassette domain-containing protein [Candidatus Korarchaeota archaeon]|nr:ATP-binding cassette domain-containing protein [Candidatus Korarchaeota archaeon]NIU83706.1 ATP-binding cassette domain-containing protein [Candidatus Thorarchaeota archaeon]NIW14891.1 ATP-binding cassette domain-containing protein [Candidatus Thorarchaeota archaeon]NIW52023.1 ATP-binding cassette domain-containing protein [Candidatus Korarchaeota archaeon]